jgi:hypothetical protein
MDIDEMVEHLELIARDTDVPPSARVRAIEVLMRIERQHPPDDAEWQRIVSQFGTTDAD